MAVTIRLDQSGINELLNSPTGPIGRLVSRTTRRVTQRARNNVNKDTGAMAAGIRSHVEIYANRWVRGIVESTDPASMWVENGTGEFARGGGGGRIYPRSSSVLRFPDRGGSQRNSNNRGGWVYAASVAGQQPQQFMWRALRQGTRGSVNWRITRDS